MAVRVILNQNLELNINEENISLMLGVTVILYFILLIKKKNLNMVCIMRSKKYDPDNINLY